MFGAGDPERARLTSTPSGGGEGPRFDILRGERKDEDDEREYERCERELPRALNRVRAVQAPKRHNGSDSASNLF